MTSTHMFHQEINRQHQAELRHAAELARLAADVKREDNGAVLAIPRRIRDLFHPRTAARRTLRPTS
jgi:hypothetical protein